MVEERLATLSVIDPLLLLLFKRGLEDFGWGQSPLGQIAIASAMQELASHVDDHALQSDIRSSASSIITRATERMLNPQPEPPG